MPVLLAVLLKYRANGISATNCIWMAELGKAKNSTNTDRNFLVSPRRLIFKKGAIITSLAGYK